MMKTFWALLLMLFAASTAYCSTYYVDPNGNDSNDGSIVQDYSHSGNSGCGRRYDLFTRRHTLL